jgi:aminoglycoside phosphotransferase (APT) family kinase protein
MTLRVPRTRASLLDLERTGIWEQMSEVERLLPEAEGLPAPTTSAVVHGDLHFRHVLVADGRASGVIDWIDLCRADPAVDLQVLWSVVPPSGRERFVAAYGSIDDARLLRARVVALSLAAQLALYGHAEGQHAIAREALDCIARTLAD